METRLRDLFLMLVPSSARKRELFAQLRSALPKNEFRDLKFLAKTRRMDIEPRQKVVSHQLFHPYAFPVVIPLVQGDEMKRLAERYNAKIDRTIKQRIFRQFAPNALPKITELIAPQVFGFEAIKHAIALQLFAKDKFHMLLLGDPGTGKTELLRYVSQLSPISSFGLGSGTSGVGLSVTVKGKEVSKGLLPLAHQGICCIDELNLMKKEDTASLYNAMEKGFVTYDKGSFHVRFEADVRVLATANPKGDRFGKAIPVMKKQLPFPPALLTRFHLVFIIRKPDKQAFLDITKKMITNQPYHLDEEDASFIRDYVRLAETLDVHFDPKLEPLITDFVKKLMRDEDHFLLEINPRLVLGIMNMAKARTRANLRSRVMKEDVAFALGLVHDALYRMP